MKGETIMGRKRLFEPGDLVKSFSGQFGLVISKPEYELIKTRIKEGKRPGHFFAAGCCEVIDYILQVPVFFEDETYDIMKAMNIKKVDDDPQDKLSKLKDMLQG